MNIGDYDKQAEGQASQDSCSLALCTPPTPPVPASASPYSHDWSSDILALAPVSDCSNFRSESLHMIAYQWGSEEFTRFPW